MEGTDAAALKQATDRLSQVAMRIGEAMYRAQQSSGEPPADGRPGAGAQAGGAANDEKVVDAEFEEVDDRKKKSG
jgi:molecular chaperone DnaK